MNSKRYLKFWVTSEVFLPSLIKNTPTSDEHSKRHNQTSDLQEIPEFSRFPKPVVPLEISNSDW